VRTTASTSRRETAAAQVRQAACTSWRAMEERVVCGPLGRTRESAALSGLCGDARIIARSVCAASKRVAGGREEPRAGARTGGERGWCGALGRRADAAVAGRRWQLHCAGIAC